MSENASESPVGKPTLLLNWVAPHRIFIERDTRWFIGLAVLVVTIAIGLVLVREATLALFIIAFGFVLFALNYVKPEMIEYQILSTGIKAGSRLYEWKDLNSYWISQKADQTMLFIKTKLLYPDRLECLLGAEDPHQIDEIMAAKLLYEENSASDFMEFIDGIITGVSFRLPRKMPKKVFVRGTTSTQKSVDTGNADSKESVSEN